MHTKEAIAVLIDQGYPLRLIARQSGVPYMKLYRYYAEGKNLSEQDQARVRVFAYVQPAFTCRVAESQENRVHNDQ